MTETEDFPNPFDRLPDTAWQPAARRELEIFGAPVELVHLPERKRRTGVPSDFRPAFQPNPAERIIREETLWEGAGCVLTPNKFPFSRKHAILWTQQHVREAPEELLLAGFRFVARHGGTALGNCIGAAASIQRAHLHLAIDELPFLDRLAREAVDVGRLIGDIDGVEAERFTSVPIAAVGLRGSVEARARAAARLIELRMTATFTLIANRDATWVFPRRAETPAPHFPYAVGAAEYWGRWCYGDVEPFERATTEDLERALVLTTSVTPP